RCRSSKRAPNILSSSAGLPAAAMRPIGMGLSRPSMTKRSPRVASCTSRGARSRKRASIRAVYVSGGSVMCESAEMIGTSVTIERVSSKTMSGSVPGPRPDRRASVAKITARVKPRASRHADRSLQAAIERQRHRAESVGGIFEECEVVGVLGPVPLRVVADDDGAGPQVGGDQLKRRPRHGDPDIHQHEVDRALDLLERLAEIAFPEIDEAAQARLVEMRSRDRR